jgi:hypothetical protein
MPISMFSSIFASSQQLLECVVELAAECRDEGMGGAEFVSTVAYGLGHVSQFSAPNKDTLWTLIEMAVTEAYEEERVG